MTKRLRSAVDQAIYDAAGNWVDQCLGEGASLFRSANSTWTLEAFNELDRAFVGNPDVSKDPFQVKLHRQLDGTTSSATQLMAELLFVHLLITMTVSPTKKREIVNEVLGWMSEPIPIPTDLSNALEGGLVNPGTYYMTGRDRALAFLIRFGVAWSAEDSGNRETMLADPWLFKEFLWTVEIDSAFSQRNAVLHLTFPDTFESITSDEHKRLIAAAYSELVTEPSPDVDRQLFQIRRTLMGQRGPAFDFYSPATEREWRPGSAGDWEEFVRWASKFYEWPAFDAEERDYKLEAATKVRGASQLLRAGDPGWLEALRRAFSNQNLTSWQAHDKFLKWCAQHADEAADALRVLWGHGSAPPASIEDFLAAIPQNAIAGRGTRVAITSFLLLGLDAASFPVYRPEPFKLGYQLTGIKRPSERASEELRYHSAVDFLDRFIDEAAGRDLLLRDRLDAQSLLWCVTKMDPLDSWTDAERRAFRSFRGDIDPVASGSESSRGEDETADTTDTAATNSLANLGERLLLDPGYLERVIKLLVHRRQVIFHGPPGTGKTYVARALANHLAGDDGTVTLVQFHPSYAYEDFVEGYRPTSDGGFALRPGPLKKIAQLAADRPESTHVLLIDEINRGNLAKVFGELYFLLEYRSEQIDLQYSDEAFALPKNLLVIGTMNTADRSIAIVDGALRRRFHFVGFYPDEPPVLGLLRRWLKRDNPALEWVADVVDRANALLDQRRVAIGPSHFMRPDLDDEWVELIWTHSILPYIEEQLYGEEDRLADFDLDRLRGTDFDSSAPTPSGDGDEAP